jgi:outer membrane cobalamin receptor
VRAAALLPFLCRGLASAAIAQDAGETPVALPEVSVSAPADTAFFAPDTASQGTVTGKEIEEQPRSRVGEVLEVVPGLIATQHSGEGKANQYFLRGFNLDHGQPRRIVDYRLEQRRSLPL